MSGDIGGRWRRIPSLLWYAEPFQDLDNDQRVVCFYAKTSPQSTGVGCYRMSTALAVEDLANITAVEFDHRLSVVCDAFGWRFDASTRVLWMPEWVAENPPASPNVVKSWVKLLANVPDCDVKSEAIEALISFLKNLGPSFLEPLRDLPRGFQNPKTKPKPKPKPNQGSGIRDQGSGKQRTGARRAVAMNDVPIEWLGTARDVVARYGHLNLDTDGLIDHFYHHGRPKAENAKRADVIAALNVALSERRTAAVQ